MPDYVKQAPLPSSQAPEAVRTTVSEMLLDIERRGDAAIRDYSRKLDNFDPPSFRVGAAEIAAAADQLSDELKQHIQIAQTQVRGFAQHQRATLTDLEVETLPGVVLSLGFLWMFLQVPFLRPFYGTILVLVVAVLVNSLTTGVQLIKSNMVQVGYESEEASFIVGASWIHTFRKIVLPLLGPALIAVALLTFSSAARNVANIVMIVSGNNRPVAMLQVDYMVDGQYERASVVGVIIVLLTLSMVWIARYIGRRAGFRTV